MSTVSASSSGSGVGTVDLVAYEDRLSSNRRWALSEASDFFLGKGGVQETLRRLSVRLNKLGIPYAVAGGMALFQHGYRRFTEDVDVLVTRQSLQLIQENLEGLGYVRPFAGSKNLRDVATGVRIEFLISGDFPGDGKPKSVAFPDPASVATEIDGIRYLNLVTLVQLKLASGMSGAGRMKDLADVQELITLLKLPESFAEQLDPYVREKFLELWRDAARADPE